MSEYRYKAFISYSHSDQRWATWLHRSLEMYRVPRRLRGFEGQFGPVEDRIRPVFKDREELGAAHSLTEEIRAALQDSESLIVICSPAAAKSRWMNEEIRLFQALGRPDRIFSIIVEGEPDAPPDKGGCFPEALVIDEQGRRHEPLAGDARPFADGKSLALEKLLAGLLGIPLDLLRRREHQRRVRRRMIGLAAVALALSVLLFSGISWQKAEQRRDSGQTLVAMKMNELRTLIRVNEDPADLRPLETWDQNEKQAAAALVAASPEDAMARSLELRDLGIEAFEMADLDTAMSQFRESWLINAMVYQADPNNSDVFFELGQAEFWIGQIHYDQANFVAAKKHFINYAEVTRQLIQEEPENPTLVLEMAYALTNLGFLARDKERDPETFLKIMQSALEYNQIALLLDPGNRLYSAELGQSLVNLANAQFDVCDIEGALETSNASVAHELKALESISVDYDHLGNLAAALSQRATMFLQLGDHESAWEDLQKSRDILVELQQRQEDRAFITRELQVRELRLADLESEYGDRSSALQRAEAIAQQWQDRWAAGGEPTLSDRDLGAYSFIAVARLSASLNRSASAINYLDQAVEQLLALKSAGMSGNRIDTSIVNTVFTGWEINGGERDARLEPYLPAESPFGSVRSCDGAMAQLKLAIMDDDEERAAYFSSFLAERGVRDPEFIGLCSDYSVCNLP